MDFYKFFRHTSLDVSLGALSSLYFAQVVLVADLPKILFFLLPATVWLIYAADHLLDAHKLSEKAKSERHRFYQRHGKYIVVVWALVFLMNAKLSLLYLDYDFLILGGTLLAPTVLYFFLVHLLKLKIPLLKELLGAILYTFGIWLIPFLNADSVQNQLGIFAILVYVLIALANLLIFALVDHRSDIKDKQFSFSQKLGKILGKKIALNASLMAIALSILIFFRAENHFYIIAGFVFLVLSIAHLYLALDLKRAAKDDLYRKLGDGIFILPGILAQIAVLIF